MVEKVGDKPIAKITKKMIQNSMEARSATPHHANNMLTAVSLMFEWAVENDHLKVNPCADVKHFKTKPARDITPGPLKRSNSIELITQLDLELVWRWISCCSPACVGRTSSRSADSMFVRAC